MVAERATVSTQGLKPIAPPSQTRAAHLSVVSTPTFRKTLVEKSQAPRTQQSDPARLSCKWELLSAVIRELLPVIKDHYEAIGLNGAPFDPDWDQLLALERAQFLLVWVARTPAGTIAGYAMVMSTADMFACRTPMASIESVWLDPAWRSGFKGIKFIKALVQSIKELNGPSTKIRIYSSEKFPIGKVYDRCGFKKTGTTFELGLK